jgi:DNA-binding response OmpR family regulator
MKPAQPLRIVIVEDNEELRDILVSGLRHFRHDVRGAADGIALDKMLVQAPADVVILDLGLPGEDGVDIARRLRRSSNCGIVILTARGKVDDRVQSFGSGADLYFVKPVDIRELDAALRSLARRVSGQSLAKWCFNAHLSRLTTPNGTGLFLTAQECLLIKKLLEIPGINVSRDEIFAVLGQQNDLYADKRLEALISRLRKKVKAACPATELPIHARNNLGYAFLAEAES